MSRSLNRTTDKRTDEADRAELQVRGAERPRRARPGLPARRRPRAVAVLADLDRHRDDEGRRGQAVAGRQGAGPARPGAQGARHGRAAGRGRHLQEGDEPARLLHAARLLAVRRGDRGRPGRRGVRGRPAGRARGQRARAARRVQLGPGQPVRAGARRASRPSTPRSRPSARSPCRACGGPRSQLGETACVIGLGLVGQLVVQLLVAAGRPGGRPRRDRGALPAGREGRRRAVRRARPTRHRPRSSRRWPRSPAASAPTRCSSPPAVAPTGRSRSPPGSPATGRGSSTSARCKLDLPWNAYYEKELDVRFSRSYGPAATTTATSSTASTIRPATCAGPSGATWRASST